MRPAASHSFARLSSLLLVIFMFSSGMPPASAQTADEPPFDIVLALDNSGSMKGNDPKAVMRPAVSAFSDRLPADSQLGIIVFDTTARVAVRLTPLTDSGFRTGLENALGQIDYKGRWTDIPGAVERALYEFREHGRPGARRIIVLFTDGFVDLGDAQRNRNRTSWLLSELVGEAQRESVMIVGIAFTDQADFELIQTVSQKTGGAYFRLLSAPDIPGVFSQVTARIRQIRAQPAPPLSPRLSAGGKPHDNRDTLVPLAWVVGGLVLVVALVGLWKWRARVLAPPVPATLQDCRDVARVYLVDKHVFRVGKVRYDRLRKNDLVIPRATVSRAHAQIRYRDGAFYIRDDGSRNHTFLTRASASPDYPVTKQLAPRTVERLENADILRFDAYEFRFGAVEEPVLRANRRNATEPTPDPEPAQPTPTPLGPSPKRKETEPPLGFKDALAEEVTETCLACDGKFPAAKMKSWEGFRICGECETNVLSLPSSHVDNHKRTLETKRRRRAATVEMR